MKLGELGVRVFFVISGYLITSILLDELTRRKRIRLRRFYFRRTMRLFPASYGLIAAVAILSALGLVSLGRWDLPFAATYTMNYLNERGWPLGHLWSLAVEEQFYFIWPATLNGLGVASSTTMLLWVVACAPLVRLASPVLTPASNFLVWSDVLAVGSLLAILRPRLNVNARYLSALASGWFWLVPAAVLAANYIPSTKVRWLLGESMMNVGIALTIDWAIRNPSHAVGRFLNLRVVSFIGVLSYSLYLWQQLFLNRDSTSPLCAFPVNIILACVMALASYWLLETPFLRLRVALEQGRFSGSE